MAHPQHNFTSNFNGSEGHNAELTLNINGTEHKYTPAGNDKEFTVTGAVRINVNLDGSELVERITTVLSGDSLPLLVQQNLDGTEDSYTYVGLQANEWLFGRVTTTHIDSVGINTTDGSVRRETLPLASDVAIVSNTDPAVYTKLRTAVALGHLPVLDYQGTYATYVTIDNNILKFATEAADPNVESYVYTVASDNTVTATPRNAGVVRADSVDTEPGTLADKLEVVDNVHDPENPNDPVLLSLEVTVDAQGKRKVAINEDNLRNFAGDVVETIGDIFDVLDGMDFDAVPHGSFGSSLNQSPGDGTTTSIQVSIFRPIETTVGDAIKWTKTTEIGGADFGTVTLEPGTYIICSDITCQWVGVPAGTYFPQVGNVLGEPFDFSQQQELHRRMTNVVTVSTTTQFKMRINFDAATPVMGFWINSAQIVKIAGGMSQTNVTHDNTLVGQGSVADPLGVNTQNAKELIARTMQGDSYKLYCVNDTLRANGTIGHTDGYYATDYLSLDGVDKFWWKGANGAYVVGLAFYDEDKVFLGYYGNLSTTYNGVEINSSEYPAGARYVRASNIGDSNPSKSYIYGVPKMAETFVLAYKASDLLAEAKRIQGDSYKLYYINDTIRSNGTITHNDGYYATDYLSLEGVEKFWWKGMNGVAAIGLAFYDENKVFLGYYGSLSTTYDGVEVKSSDYPVGAKYVRASDLGNPNPNASYIYGVPTIAETFVLASKAYHGYADDSGIIMSSLETVYGVAPSTSYGRDYAIKLYIEGVVRDRTNATFAGGAKSKFIQSEVSLPVSGGTLTTDHVISINGKNRTIHLVRSSNTRGQNKLMNVLCIGDSILDIDLADANGNRAGGWNYASCVKELMERDNKDIGSIKVTMVGTRNNHNGRTIDYGGETISIRSYSEGRSGWTSYGYLNFPCPVKMGVAYESAARLNSSAAWYALGLATKTPFDSSVPSQVWESFTNSDSQQMAIATTPFGRYKVDVGNSSSQYSECSDLWQRVNFLNGNFSPSAYTGTAEQKAFITDYFDGIIVNPINPFYSKAKAQAYTGNYSWTNDNAFSLTEYLSRYRTMDDLGVPLSGSAGDSVVGSDGRTYTIGSKVTSVADYDVCTPNYVFVGTGTNDVDSSVTIAEKSISDIIDCICAEDENIKVAWGIPRSPFVFDNCYPNVNAKESSSGGVRFDINEVMMAELTDSSQNSRKFFLPIYNTMSVIGGNKCKASKELDSEFEVISAGNDNVHPSLYQSRTIAYQIYSWLYYIN